MSAYPAIGNTSRLTGSFTDENGVPADPSTVTVQYEAPGSASVTATPVRDAVGEYHYDIELTVAGRWFYRFIGTGAITAQTADGFFDVPLALF